MSYEQFLKQKQFTDIQSGFSPNGINAKLFDHQKTIVEWALKRGRAAIFADTGLGKTAMQTEWARHVHAQTGGNVLIFAPLCVARQTVEESAKFGIEVTYCREQSDVMPGINVTNYEMMDKFEYHAFSGVVLDESSILKSQDGKTRRAITNYCRQIPYRLSCTATPSPNDHMELANQAEWLGIMSASEMLAMFFTHDSGNTSKWRLKGHGRRKFWEWMATWAVVVKKPSDLGFSDDGYSLPGLNIHTHLIESDGSMSIASTLTERRQAKRETLSARVSKVADMVNASSEQWIVWCHLNDESDELGRAIPDAVTISGADSIAVKEDRMMGFTSGKYRVLVTKPSIAGFGMNWQHCANVAFVGLDDSYEQFYQAVRRCYRFGQKRDVNVHVVTAPQLAAIAQNIQRKEDQATEMQREMVAYMAELTKQQIKGATMEKAHYEREIATGKDWILHLGDCIEVARDIPENSIDYSIFSPPFASLYVYSNSDRDMGNSKNYNEFGEHFRFLVKELYRVLRPGRLLSFHCMNLPLSKQNDGVIGIRDFRGDLVRLFVQEGFIFHSEVCIWKDPVTAMQRTKAIGLLHKQLKKDSALSRQGIPDYLVTMRKPGANDKPISHTNESFPVDRWQRYASPVWMDISQSRTLNRNPARENDDERHICPLQLDVIERAMELWTTSGDVIFSPFAGIGSEGFVALGMGRSFIGSELKRAYFEIAKKNLQSAEVTKPINFDMFDEAISA